MSLGCLDALAIAQQIKMEVKEDEDHPLQSSECSKDDYAVVNRFERLCYFDIMLLTYLSVLCLSPLRICVFCVKYIDASNSYTLCLSFLLR